MLSRREVITAGLAGGLSAPSDAAALPLAPGQQIDREVQREVQRALESIESTLRNALLSNSVAYGNVSKIRQIMEVFFRANTKFPDFIDIGISVFMDLYDWHVKNRQQLMVTRAPDGRYWLQFMFTSMVLRQEVDPNHIGIPYDKA